MRVVLLEGRSFCGGRAYAFREPTLGTTIDNGQHLLMGCYRATFEYLRHIGSLDQVSILPRLQVDFLGPDARPAPLVCPGWPAPWHLLAGLSRWRGVSWRDIWGLARRAGSVRRMDADDYATLDRRSVSEWLDTLEQGAQAREWLWTPLCLAIMNETPARASAAPFVMMLRDGLLDRTAPAGLAYPRTDLSNLLVTPALKFLRVQGALIQMGQVVTDLEYSNGRVQAVQCRNGQRIAADRVIVALPPRALQELVGHGAQSSHPYWHSLAAWDTVPIVSVHLWYDRPVLTRPMTGLIGSRFHWAFDKTAVLREVPDQGHCVALVVSAGRAEAAWSRAEVIRAAQDEMQRYFPAARGAQLRHAQVTKELHATVSLSKGSAARRLPTVTPWANLFLAGDWTQTHLPATIEGAIRSGQAAARAAAP